MCLTAREALAKSMARCVIIRLQQKTGPGTGAHDPDYARLFGKAKDFQPGLGESCSSHLEPQVSKSTSLARANWLEVPTGGTEVSQ